MLLLLSLLAICLGGVVQTMLQFLGLSTEPIRLVASAPLFGPLGTLLEPMDLSLQVFVFRSTYMLVHFPFQRFRFLAEFMDGSLTAISFGFLHRSSQVPHTRVHSAHVIVSFMPFVMVTNSFGEPICALP